ncbi:hypothetical protein ACRRTK_009957 [Alexandromys fortis]
MEYGLLTGTGLGLGKLCTGRPADLPTHTPLLLAGDVQREIHSAPHVSEKLIQLFRNKSEFTFLATVQQKPSTSGVILSIRELEHRASIECFHGNYTRHQDVEVAIPTPLRHSL